MTATASIPTPQLKIVEVPIKDLRPAAYNPRKFSAKQLADLRESFMTFGVVKPLILNKAKERHNVVIGGHMRLKLAKELKLKAVPAVYLDIPDIKKERELNLRLNKNQGEWDFELLKAYDMTQLLTVGFGEDELSAFFQDCLPVHELASLPQAAEEAKTEPTVTFGDIWQLGNHFLLCGDSTKTEHVRTLMNGINPAIVLADPPYNIKVDYDRGLSKQKAYGGDVNDNLSEDEYANFLRSFIASARAVTGKNAHYFVWCDAVYVGLVQAMLREQKVTMRRLCLWIKNNFNPTPKVAFSKGCEVCVYGTQGKPTLAGNNRTLTEILNQDIDTGNRAIEDIQDYLNLWLVKRDHTTTLQHPTQKPITLMEKPLRRCSNVGDVILELFGGAGASLLAAEQLGRKAYVCEINPIFCDVIIQRWEELTGKTAVKLRTLEEKTSNNTADLQLKAKAKTQPEKGKKRNTKEGVREENTNQLILPAS